MSTAQARLQQLFSSHILKALLAQTILLIVNQCFPYLKQPGTEPPTIQLVDDLLYFLSHSVHRAATPSSVGVFASTVHMWWSHCHAQASVCTCYY